MCTVKAPKITQPTDADKNPIIVRNPYLDGVGPAARAQRMGRNNLRIARGTAANPSPPRAAISVPRPEQTGFTPIAQSGGAPSAPMVPTAVQSAGRNVGKIKRVKA